MWMKLPLLRSGDGLSADFSLCFSFSCSVCQIAKILQHLSYFPPPHPGNHQPSLDEEDQQSQQAACLSRCQIAKKILSSLPDRALYQH